jgi:alanine racemase
VYNSGKISEILNGKLIGNPAIEIKHILSDSRSITFYPESVFFALVSSRNNGHKYIRDMYDKGVRSFVVSEEKNIPDHQDASFILVRDTLEALQKLATFHREQFHLPVIGITGSNGKTIVKEWLYQILKQDHVICRSPKSYNSQIGVPLSVWNLGKQHNLGIFEAGISTVNEMQKLESIIKPAIGVFSGYGEAHREGFSSKEEKIREKFSLFKDAGTIVVQGLKRSEIPSSFVTKNIILVSEDPEADVVITKTTFEPNYSIIHLRVGNKEHVINIPFTDKASIINATTCLATLIAMGSDFSRYKQAFKTLQAIALRLEIKNGINNSVLINDFYNSDIDSLQIALNYLHQQSRNTKRVVILSDIEQSGQSESQLYKEISVLLKRYEVSKLIGIGKNISEHKEFFQNNSEFYEGTDDFTLKIPALTPALANSTILLKGARSFGFEKISRSLQQKSHDTVLEIDLNKLVANINYYKGLLMPGTNIMCMVKAMGYGSGSSEIARTLQHVGVNYLAVAYADEGLELRNAHIDLPVMVMSPELDSLEDIIQFNLEPEIYSFRILGAFSKQLDRSGISEPFPIHIKIDTGMHRLGFEEKDWNDLAELLVKSPQVKVQSVFSHLVASDNPDLDDFTRQQIKLFEQACSVLEQKLGYTFLKHICNSGGISRFINAHYDMVRLGIGMYGVGINSDEQQKLENVGSLKTKISQIKQVNKGDTVGYNRNGKVQSDTLIATIPIGYADGFRRELGNGKFGVYINGQYCKTVGNICMDMCMIDINSVACKEGDDVIIFENFDQISKMSQILNTIPYEVLTGISSRVKRIYIQE